MLPNILGGMIGIEKREREGDKADRDTHVVFTRRFQENIYFIYFFLKGGFYGRQCKEV